MGEALARGLVASGEAEPTDLRLTVRTTKRAELRSRETGFVVTADNVAATRDADIVLLAVKPHGVLELLRELVTAGALQHAPLVVSIVAGVTLEQLAQAAPAVRWVRVMPNTPCRIGDGMSVLSPAADVAEEDTTVVERLFDPLGRTLVLEERYLDVVTGLSASGPAFVYVIIEALAEGGLMMGLPRRVATELAAQAVRGAATMVLETGRHPAELKDQVTTPAGCTVAGLLALEDGKLRSVLARAVQEATRAASRLGQEGSR